MPHSSRPNPQAIAQMLQQKQGRFYKRPYGLAQQLQVPDGHGATVVHSDGSTEEFGPHDPDTGGHLLPHDSRVVAIGPRDAA